MNPALANWIKAQEEDKRKHAEKMAIKNSQDAYLVFGNQHLTKE